MSYDQERDLYHYGFQITPEFMRGCRILEDVVDDHLKRIKEQVMQDRDYLLGRHKVDDAQRP